MNSCRGWSLIGGGIGLLSGIDEITFPHQLVWILVWMFHDRFFFSIKTIASYREK